MCSLFSLFCYQESEGTLTFALAYNFSLKTVYVLKRFWVVLTINLGTEISLLRPWSFRAETEDCSLSLTHRHSLNTYCQWSVVFSHHDPWAASDSQEDEHWSHNALSPMCQTGSRALNMGYLILNPLRPPLCSLCPFYNEETKAQWSLGTGTLPHGKKVEDLESECSLRWARWCHVIDSWPWAMRWGYSSWGVDIWGSVAPVFLLPYMLDISHNYLPHFLFLFLFLSFFFSLSHIKALGPDFLRS